MGFDRRVTVRLPSWLVEKAARYADVDGYSNFSQLIRDLLDAYVKAHQHTTPYTKSRQKSTSLAGSLVTFFSRVRKG